MWRTYLLVFTFTFLLSGCWKAGTDESSQPEVTPSFITDIARLPPPETKVLSVPISATLSAPISSPTIAVTPTLLPTPTLPPMSILAMRDNTYPGSDIVIETELEPGVNYRRFYAYYLSEGLKIYALLTVPNGTMPAGGWPAIVFNHGYIPPKEYRTTERYIVYVDRLARARYIVFRIDYRGNDRSEGTATGAYGDPGYTVDVLNAVASLQRFQQADPQKIGMWGHSMGGLLTLRAMVISDAIHAGVIWSGVVGSHTDLLYNWHRIGPTPTPRSQSRGWRAGWIELYGTPEDNPDFWNSISANTYLIDLSGPLQLHHGTADKEVPLEFSEKLAANVQAAGEIVDLFTYPENDHNLSQSFELAMDRTINFYDRFLK